MHTIVYIDGYNLYYGLLQGTAWKWLDPRALLEPVIHTEAPGSDIRLVRYFTSPVIARLATRGAHSVEAQNSYIKALRARGVDIQFGRHQVDRGHAPRCVDGVPPNRADSVPVWLLNEKETDVRLALAMYRDAANLRSGQIVLVSGDSDMVPALEAIKEDFDIQVGLILPRRADGGRTAPAALPSLADWTRTCIHDEELARAQLPHRVPTRRKPAVKPDYW